MAARLIALFVLAMSLLPVANWLPGGASDPAYASRMLNWLNGLALCVGVGVLAAFIARARHRSMGADTMGVDADSQRSVGYSLPPMQERAVVAMIALGAFVTYAVIARYVFSGRPLLIDEVVQVLQARWYAAGELWIPVSEHREFFSIMHVVDLGDRVFGQFPAGGPAMLALGSLIGAEWLVGPAAGAVSVLLFGRLLAHLEPDATSRWRLGTLLLFALAPFGAFMFGSHMNHATTLLWLLVAALALERATRSADAPPWWGLAAGLALGLAATIRPLDGVAYALPAAAWLSWRARRGGRPLRTLLCSGVGVAAPLAALLWVNTQTTGDPLLFGYDQLWGAGHALGFHDAAWGPAHTPQRGLELASLYFTRLSTYLFEAPFPAMLLVAGGLWLSGERTLRPLERYLIASAGFVVIGYWAYWHDGYYLGPRFYFTLLPLLVLWTARLPAGVRRAVGGNHVAWTAVRAALAAGVVMAIIDLAFVRIPSYRSGLTSMRFDIERESAEAGVEDALVLVKESWGTRLIVRMWALGVPRSATERLYRFSDACKLELTISELERAGVTGPEAISRLFPLLADSAYVIRLTVSPDSTAGMLPGHAYAPECRSEIASDRLGYSHLAPFLLAKDGNVYARWLPGREAELAGAYPGRRVYRLTRAGPEDDAEVLWERLPAADR